MTLFCQPLLIGPVYGTGMSVQNSKICFKLMCLNYRKYIEIVIQLQNTNYFSEGNEIQNT